MFVDAGLSQSRVDYGNDVLLVGARGELGYYATVFFVYFLRGYDVAEQNAVLYNGGARVVT